jgi:2-methylcitrate dehydratase PrpD
VQTPVELARQLAQENNLDPRKIDRVSIRAPQATYTNPGFKNVAPFATQLQAHISARFCTAAALLGKPLESQALYQCTSDPDVLTLAEKIELLEPSDDTERVYLEVTYDGTTLCKTGMEMDTMRPSLEKAIAKFRRLTADLPGARSGQLIDTVLNLERVKHIRELTDQLQGAKH